MSIHLGNRVRVKGTKIEGVAAADEMLNGARRVRVDHTDDGKDNQTWASEGELEVIEEKATAPARTEDRPR